MLWNSNKKGNLIQKYFIILKLKIQHVVKQISFASSSTKSLLD